MFFLKRYLFNESHRNDMIERSMKFLYTKHESNRYCYSFYQADIKTKNCQQYGATGYFPLSPISHAAL